MGTLRTRNKVLLFVLAALCALALALGVTALAPAPERAFAAEEHTNHDGWTPLTETGGTLSGGNYYLDQNITLTNDLTFSGTVTLCLNGYKLTGTGSGSVITVNSGIFTLCDCQSESTAEEHRHVYYISDDALYTFDDGTDEWDAAYQAATTEDQGTITGGVITGGNAEEGGGIYVKDSTFTMDGGTIAGNISSFTTYGGRGGGIFAYYCEVVMNEGAVCGNISNYGGGIGLGNSVTGACAFIMNGGIISDNHIVGNNTGDAYGGGIYATYAEINIKGGTIENNSSRCDYAFGGGVYVENEKFSMTGGTVSGNNADGNEDAAGGGIAIFESDEVVIGGEAQITGNSCSLNGGGVFIGWGSNLSMTGGTIANNEAYYGGGIYSNDSTLMIGENAAISNNTSETYGGGVYAYYSEITMNGGTIAENVCTVEYGGGLYIDTSTMTMIDGTISENSVNRGYGGGIAVVFDSVLNMSYGDIKDNDSYMEGGGVYVSSSEIYLMGGTIAGNESLGDGGGIYSDDSTIDMSGGSIEKNTACIDIQNGGGGIFVNSGSELNLSGGKIIDNVTYGNSGGGGIHAQSELTKINISGAPVVSGNKFIKEESSELESNLLLREDCAAKANILGQLTDGAKIGVTLYYYDSKTKDRLSVTGLVTEGYSDYNTVDPSEYFFADNADYTVVLNGDGEAELVVNSYTVVYVVDGARTEKEYIIGEALTLEKVTAEEGYLGGWSLTEGGTSIDYSSGQTFAEGLGKAHGDVITLYAVQVRDYASDVEDLRSELEAAVEQMNAAIDALEEQIGKDVAQEVSALTQKIEALDEAYKAADALLEGKIGALESADASLASQISALTSSLNEAKNTLQSAVDQVAADLVTAKAELQAAIDANEKDIEEKLAALDEAYKAADALLASDIAGLESSVGELNEADEALKAAIDALDAAYKAADEAILEAVEELRAENAAQSAELERQDAELNTLSVVLYISLAVAVVALGVGTAGLVFGIKAGKRDNSAS